MSFSRYLGILKLVTALSGPVVVMAINDIHARLRTPSEEEVASTKKLVEALRGDVLFSIKANYKEEQKLPSRSQGGLLADYDVRKIKGFIVRQLGDGAKPEDDAANRAQMKKARPAEEGKY